MSEDRKGDRSRALIVEKAKKILAKDGFSRTTFGKIAQAARLKQPAIYYYFDNKEDLLRTVIDDLIRNSHRVVAQHTESARSAEQKLRQHFYGTLDWVLNYPTEAKVLMLLYYYASNNDKYVPTYQRILQTARQRILEILQAAETEGRLKSGINLIAEAGLLHDALLGGIINTVASGTEVQEIKRLKMCWQIHFKRLFR